MAIYANVRYPDGHVERNGPLAVGQTKETYRAIVMQAGLAVVSFEDVSDFVPKSVTNPTTKPPDSLFGGIIDTSRVAGAPTISTLGGDTNVSGSGNPVQNTTQFDFPAIFQNLSWKGWAIVGLGLWLLFR